MYAFSVLLGNIFKGQLCFRNIFKSIQIPCFFKWSLHGWRSLLGYSPWDCKESDMTERLHFTSLHFTSLKEFSLIWSEVTQSCPTLCDPMDCRLAGSSIHGILQARILKRVTISFSRGSSRSRDWSWVSRIVGRRFNLWATREALQSNIVLVKPDVDFLECL